MLKLVGCEGSTIYKSGYAVHGRGYLLREQAVALKVSGMRDGRCGVSQRVSSVVCPRSTRVGMQCMVEAIC